MTAESQKKENPVVKALVPAVEQTGCRHGRCQQTPRLPVLPAKDWPLPHRAIPPVDDQTPGHEVGGASTASKPMNICSRTAPSGGDSRNPSGQPSWRRPRSSQAPLGGGTVPKLRSCSPMSGAAKRSSFSRNHRRRKDVRPTGQWWQETEAERPARLRSGNTGSARNNSHL